MFNMIKLVLLHSISKVNAIFIQVLLAYTEEERSLLQQLHADHYTCEIKVILTLLLQHQCFPL